ncbi:hypothetical protein ACQKWADRAFT_291195 [Trichoderma austrokoningii]
MRGHDESSSSKFTKVCLCLFSGHILSCAVSLYELITIRNAEGDGCCWGCYVALLLVVYMSCLVLTGSVYADWTICSEGDQDHQLLKLECFEKSAT